MDLTEDLKKIQGIDQDKFREICELLNQKSDDDDWTISIAKAESSAEGTGIHAFLRFFEFLVTNLVDARDYQARLDRLNEIVITTAEEDSKALAGWELVKSSLNNLGPYFQAKKEEILKDRFSRITKFQITTDIRPVLNNEKNVIKKSLITNILKIETIDEKTYVCEFYDDEIDDIINELERTKNKIELLREHYGK